MYGKFYLCLLSSQSLLYIASYLEAVTGLSQSGVRQGRVLRSHCLKGLAKE